MNCDTTGHTNKFVRFICYSSLILAIFKDVDIFSVQCDWRLSVSKQGFGMNRSWPFRRDYPDIRWKKLKKPMTNSDDVSRRLYSRIKHTIKSTDRTVSRCHISQGRIMQRSGHTMGWTTVKLRFDPDKRSYFLSSYHADQL